MRLVKWMSLESPIIFTLYETENALFIRFYSMINHNIGKD